MRHFLSLCDTILLANGSLLRQAHGAEALELAMGTSSYCLESAATGPTPAKRGAMISFVDI